jgi:hypothetical protein
MGRSVDLLLPGLTWRSGLLSQKPRAERVEQLETLLNRAKQRHHPSSGLTETLFHLFGISAKPDRDLPAGAVSFLGSGGEPGQACWALATPIHLLADRDQLILIHLGANVLDFSQTQQRVAQFNDYFNQERLSISAPTPDEWYLKLSCVPEVSTFSIEKVAGRPVEHYLPKGKDAMYWHKVLNETQMLFFQNEVNPKRGPAGELSVNALWLSGIEVLPIAPKTDYCMIYALHPLAKGLARLTQIQNSTLPEPFEQNDLPEGRSLILMTELMEAELTAHLEAWEAGWVKIQKILDKLLKYLDLNKDALSIYTCQGQCFEVRKLPSLRNLFKRKRPLNQLLG